MAYVVKFKIGEKQKYLRLEPIAESPSNELSLLAVNREVQATIFGTRAHVLRLLAKYSTELAAMDATELPTTKAEVEENISQVKYSGRIAATTFYGSDDKGRPYQNLDPTVGFGEDPEEDPESSGEDDGNDD